MIDDLIKKYNLQKYSFGMEESKYNKLKSEFEFFYPTLDFDEVWYKAIKMECDYMDK